MGNTQITLLELHLDDASFGGRDGGSPSAQSDESPTAFATEGDRGEGSVIGGLVWSALAVLAAVVVARWLASDD